MLGGGRRRQPGARRSGRQCQRGEGPRPSGGLPTGHLSGCDSAPRRRRASGFPPPLHPQTGTPLQNKGPDEHTILTVNGRISLKRRRYAAADVGSCTLWIAGWTALKTIEPGPARDGLPAQPGLAELRQGRREPGTDAQVHVSGELLRQVVESEGKAIQAAARAGSCPWTGAQATSRRWTRRGADGAYACLPGQRRGHGAQDDRRGETETAQADQGQAQSCGRKRRPLPKAR